MKEQEINNERTKGREITISVLKYNPRSKVSKPHFVEFKLEETPGMTLLLH